MMEPRRFNGNKQEVETTANEHMVFVTGRWSRNLVVPALITLSVTSLFAGVVLVSQTFGSTLPWIALIWLFLLVSLEGLLTSYWLAAPERRHVDRVAYRAAEFLVIAIMVRMFTWALTGEWPELRLLPNYLASPLVLFDDPFFLIGLVLTFLAWRRTNDLGELFARLNVDRAEAKYYTMPAAERESGNRPLSVNRGRLMLRFFQQWIGGGIVLIICVGLSTFDLSRFAKTFEMNLVGRLALSPQYPSVLIVYFISGLLLLSQARLAAMDARWLIAGLSKSPRVDRSWYRFSAWLIVIVAFLAAFLPLGSTFAISHIMGTIVEGILILFGLLTSLFFAFLSLLIPGSSLTEAGSEGSVGPDQTLPPPASAPSASDSLAGLIFSSIFWAVAIFVTLTAIVFFLRDRGIRIDIKTLRSFWRATIAWLQGVWHGLSSRLVAARQIVRIPIRMRLRAERPDLATRWRLIRINALSPREQLRYFYLSIVRRAGASGVERESSETPLEYAQDLKKGWPEAGDKVDALTHAFLKARYSREIVRRKEVGLVRQQWRRLKRRVRRRRGQQANS